MSLGNQEPERVAKQDRRSHIVDAMDIQGTNLSALENNWVTLFSRIEPVLGTEILEEKEPSAVVEKLLAPLGEDLRQNNGRIWTIVRQMETVIARLEL